mmetsp:Transcript_21915/g.16255  ORF Transcript_21915/g.16255 Transcript_21915/m.16255 type:complete len:133 (+) Transcript_21915:110-508(+)
MDYLRATGRDPHKVALIEAYLRAQDLFVLRDGSQPEPTYSGDLLELDLSSVKPCLAGPKRPHDKVLLADMKADFNKCLESPVGFKGYNIAEEKRAVKAKFAFQGQEYELSQGSVVIAAITSCTNTSNPEVML